MPPKFWTRRQGRTKGSLTQALTLPLAVIGEAPIPGLRLAATALQEIIRRAACIDDNKAGLGELATQMNDLLSLSAKVKGDTGTAAVAQLQATTEDIRRQIPADRTAIVAFFLADETKAKIQLLGSQLGTAVQLFQVALHINTDEKVEQVLKARKVEIETPLNGRVLQELNDLQLNTRGKLDFSAYSVDEVTRRILNTNMRSPQSFKSTIVGRGGVRESLQSCVIDTDGDIGFTTIAGDPADFAAWSDVLRRYGNVSVSA
ncbi:hypothetical protein FB45DRAFT_915036 [Roridomyces roridus]|uniref:Uncharacterized protein n=1 Tax=Roridomyces roridus TaxID=1738132 RepID=A0AAD7BTD6_9AGAR|nr:hypothetical protein FB45DRAFT_915036 [Roridomyces roridus]